MTDTTTKETLGFQAEVTQLLHLMIHSLYGNKEIFLRELVSNASDAVRQAALRGAGRRRAVRERSRPEDPRHLRHGGAHDHRVRQRHRHVARRRSSSTSAPSPSRARASSSQHLTADRAKDAQLIGQFGVGFYSAFIVADRVTLLTRRAGLGAEHGVRWESTGEGDYTVETVRQGRARHRRHPAPAPRGRRAALRLPAARDPAEVLGPHHRPDPDEEGAVGRRREGAGRRPTRTSRSTRRRRCGRGRSREITEEQYHEFYKHVAHDFEPPLACTHAKVEGRQEFTQLLFMPQRAPFDLWDREHRRGIKLYVRRVFIMDDAEQLLPAYLRFVRGVVDSNDLPLNVSREILQQSRDVQAIRDGVGQARARRCSRIWPRTSPRSTRRSGRSSAACSRKASPRTRRTGSGSRSCCASRRRTSDADEQTVSLADYVGRMKEGQDAIYYITADGFAGGEEQPAPRDLPQARRRGAAAVTTASTSGWCRR